MKQDDNIFFPVTVHPTCVVMKWKQAITQLLSAINSKFSILYPC